MAALAVGVFGAGCSGGDPAGPAHPTTAPDRSTTTTTTTSTTAPPPPDVRFTATLLQYRPDEGTNRLEVELTNRSPAPVTVRAVQLRWSGVRDAPRTPKDTDYAVGQTIDLTTTYGTAACDVADPADRPGVTVTLDDGRTVRLTLDQHGVDMLKRFRTRDCALQRLAYAATVEFDPDFHSVHIGGDEYLSSTLVLRRPDHGDTATAVTVATLTGSVLLTFTAPPAAPLPVTLRPGEPELRVPVLIGSTFRCDDHSRSQSTQTFLLSAYLRIGDDRAQQRVILVPDAEVRAQAGALMDRACRHGR